MDHNELERVLDRTPFMLTRCGRDLRYRFVSRSYADMIRCRAEDVAGKPIVEVMGEEGFKTILPHIEKVLAGDRVEYETEVNFAGVGPRLLRVIYQPDHDGSGMIDGWIASIIDLSDRRRTDEALHHLANIVDSSQDAIVSKDLNGTIVSWNPGAERLFGYSAEEVVGKPITILIPRELEHEEQIILDHIRRGEQIRQYETRRRRKDGTTIDISLNVSPVRNASGRIAGASKIARDITEWRRVREQRAADLRAMTLLRELAIRCVRDDVDIDRCLQDFVEAAIAITKADKGNLQLFDSRSGGLIIRAQFGFEKPFLEFFKRVADEGSACAAAMRSIERIIVEDVELSEIFAGQPSKRVLLEAGVRAVTSVPLTSSKGNVLGMISVHFCEPHRPNDQDLGLIDLLARQASDYLQRKETDEITGILIRELRHRNTNLFAVIQAIADRSLSGDYTLAQAKTAFEGRLWALSRANQLVTKSNGSNVNLRHIVESELESYAGRTNVDGINVTLGPQDSRNLSLAVHELATNSIKHGALSNGSGNIGISWSVNGTDSAAILKFRWCESGGPPVQMPTRKGFGTYLLRTAFKNVRLDFASGGFNCEIDVPLGEKRQ